MSKKRHLLSYLAGVFDGEGCVLISKQASRRENWSTEYRVVLRVSMSDGVVPLLFQNVFGGGLNKHYYNRKHSHRKMQYCWEITGHKCLTIMKELLPYSLIKRPQLEVCIHFLENTSHGGKGPHMLTDKELALREADYILAKNLKKQPISPVFKGGG